MKRLLIRKLRDLTGQSMVEISVLLLFLWPLTIALVDLSRAITAHNAIVNMSREGANLASRSMLIHKPNGAQMIMNAVAGTAKGLDMKANGMMYLIEVQGVGGMPSIKDEPTAWEQRVGGPPCTVNDSNLASVLGKIKVGERDTVWIFEVFYQYPTLFPDMHGFRPQLHSLAIFAGGLR